METLNKHDIYFTEADISLEIFDSVMPPCPVSFGACNAEQCVEFQERVMSFYSEYKKLWEENKGVKIKWMENTNSLLSQIKLLEFHNEQKQRFLDKQTHLVECDYVAQTLYCTNMLHKLSTTFSGDITRECCTKFV
jgi:hypothetical protein